MSVAQSIPMIVAGAAIILNGVTWNRLSATAFVLAMTDKVLGRTELAEVGFKRSKCLSRWASVWFVLGSLTIVVALAQIILAVIR